MKALALRSLAFAIVLAAIGGCSTNTRYEAQESSAGASAVPEPSGSDRFFHEDSEAASHNSAL